MAKPKSGRNRALLFSIGLPVLLALFGIWELARIAPEPAQRVKEHAFLIDLQRQVDADPDRPGLQYKIGDQVYSRAMLQLKIRDRLDDTRYAVPIARVRWFMPPVVVVCAGVAAFLSLGVLSAAFLTARAGLRDRDRLARGFLRLQRAMRPVLAAQIVLVSLAGATAMLFEVLSFPEYGDYSKGAVKLFLLAVIGALGILVTVFRSVRQFRRMIDLFEPEPMPVSGRLVRREEAPGLWRLLDDVAAQLDALKPERVVVGLTDGFWVSSGPKLLLPERTRIDGRTLYLSLPLLALMEPEEVAAVIGHELAHFAGADTEYSLRFLPIYVGVENAVGAVLRGGSTKNGSAALLSLPALQLGAFVMERFHLAVRHWSRTREFEADALGARVSGGHRIGSALLRIGGAAPLFHTRLRGAFEAPGAAPADLVPVLVSDAVSGLDDPARHLEESQPHPTDTHPPTRQRLEALGLDPEALAATVAVSRRDAHAERALERFFADPSALCREVTARFLAEAHQAARQEQVALRVMVDRGPQEDQAIRENRWITGLYLMLLAPLLSLFASAFGFFGFPALGVWQQWIGTALLLSAAAWFVAGVWFVCRTVEPVMVLMPDGVRLRGIEQPIAWSEVADMDLRADRKTSMRFLLTPEAAFPAGIGKGGSGSRLDREQRIIWLRFRQPRRLPVRSMAALIDSYRNAAMARDRLRVHDSAPPPPLQE